MELRKVFLVLADISGYTKFITSHKTGLLHAEAIITDLMESVIDHAEFPLQLNKLEGDAALFFAPAEGTPEAARDILMQIQGVFDAFYARLWQLEEFRVCDCLGCVQAQQLNLKAIVHHGEAAIKRIRQFEELAGEDVILAHRLLKNSIAQKEYILMSEPFFRLAGGLREMPVEERAEHCDGIGKVKVFVQYPQHTVQIGAAPRPVLVTRWRKLSQLAMLQWGTVLRLMGARKAVFHNLPV
jgi:class 3 adenylate cyclase